MVFFDGLPSFASIVQAILNLFGLFQTPVYDAIIVGAGAGGCPLAQTLIEGGLRVLLIERGDEPPESSKSIRTFDKVLLSECTETFFSKSEGVVLAAGKCMGGGTSINQGIWIEETADWVQEQFGGSSFATADEIEAAFVWSRDRVARPTAEEPGSPVATYLKELLNSYERTGDFVLGDVDTARPNVDLNKIFRTYSTFDPETRVRRSADTLLDRDNPNLDIRLKTEVSHILFDGDWDIPWGVAGHQSTDGDVPRARCVRFTSLETVCVKPQGRIYLAGGAFHTPEILLKSGIGPGGKRVDSPNVGTHLNDKPGFIFISNPSRDFAYPDDVTISHLAAMRQESETSSLLLFEHYFSGLDSNVVLNWAIFERIFVPTRSRDSFFADLSAMFKTTCESLLDSNIWFVSDLLCREFVALERARCASLGGGLFSFVVEPTSTGEVLLGPRGDLQISVNYLATPEDAEAYGALSRSAFQVLKNVEGSSAPQTGCDDPLNEECIQSSCPDLFVRFFDFVHSRMRLLDPAGAKTYPECTVSSVTPPWLETVITEYSNDDATTGSLLGETLITPQHFAGTAAVGRVLDRNFRVMGAEGLYVADGSAIPKTARVNPMATVMMVGRLAGLKYLENNDNS